MGVFVRDQTKIVDIFTKYFYWLLNILFTERATQKKEKEACFVCENVVLALRLIFN